MKSLFEITLFSLITIFTLTSGIAQTGESKLTNNKQTEILLIGTFHFNNPGADVAQFKTFDVLKDETQKELEEIAQKIAAFNPTKIFVEWNYKEQKELDSLYGLYKAGKLYNKKLSNFYKTNEIFQLAFRAGKLNDNSQIDAIDYNKSNFPFEKVMASIKKNNQTEIEEYITSIIQKYESDFNAKIVSNSSLKEILYEDNSKDYRKEANEFYEKILTVGDDTDFIGAYLTSEWNRRNLYMWSLIKKKTTLKDERVMVLLGASHIANIKNLIDANENWKTVELIYVVEGK